MLLSGNAEISFASTTTSLLLRTIAAATSNAAVLSAAVTGDPAAANGCRYSYCLSEAQGTPLVSPGIYQTTCVKVFQQYLPKM
jgi:hypothetical protein